MDFPQPLSRKSSATTLTNRGPQAIHDKIDLIAQVRQIRGGEGREASIVSAHRCSHWEVECASTRLRTADRECLQAPLSLRLPMDPPAAL